MVEAVDLRGLELQHPLVAERASAVAVTIPIRRDDGPAAAPMCSFAPSQEVHAACAALDDDQMMRLASLQQAVKESVDRSGVGLEQVDGLGISTAADDDGHDRMPHK